MAETSLKALLERRGAWLKGVPGDHDRALARANLTRLIADDYLRFEQVRDRIFRATEAFMRHVEIIPETLTPEEHILVAELVNNGLVVRGADGHEICDTAGRRYLSGGWLEELAWLAAMAAGADEAVYGQILAWTVRGYSGENEVDLIIRRGETLAFVSCKALRSELDITDRKHRNRLMDAVHEADNLADHFGQPGERVAVLVTTDLFDEMRGVARYNALMGKAAVLDVRIIPLEELGWDKLVFSFSELMNDRKPETAEP
ncbi:MAG TPA: hypothetical protein PKE19_03330 [Aestuariivirga sp.]|nr:hypothetical protein [Aestuariivirga sp.]